MERKRLEKYIELYKPLIASIQACFGDKIEFIVHDTSKPESSVMYVVGSVTQRKLGAPLTNIVIRTLLEHGDNAPDMLGYASLSKDGRNLKSSTIFIRDDDGHIIGCLCYNLDLTDFIIAEKLIKCMSTIHDLEPEEEKKDKNEIFAQDIGEVVEEIIHYEIAKSNKPVAVMSKNDKLQLMRSLEAKGVFNVKNSAEMMAHIFGTSVYTIYNYLKEIRSDSKYNAV